MSNPREFGDKKGQKPKIFLKCGEGERLEIWSIDRLLACPLGAGVKRSLAILLTLAKMYRVPSFCPLYCSALGASALNMALFRVLRAFLEGFMGFVWVCLACVLFVACGAFVRVNS